MLGSYSNSGLGFGLAFSLRDEFSSTARNIQGEMGRLESSTARLEQKINSSMNGMMLGAGMTAAGLAVLAPFGFGARLQAEFEQAEVALTTLLGSSEKASEVFDNIKRQAALTPFGTRDLMQANTALISQQIEAGRAEDIVNNLGNALAAVGKGSPEMARMSLNLQQIAANGKATAMDMRQFASSGINMMKLIADATGKTVKELDGVPITLEMIELALSKASQEGGMFEGAMERMSQSVFGKWSTMKDNIEFTFASLGEAIEPLTHKLLDMAIAFTDVMQRILTSPLGKFLAKLAAGTGILLVTLGTLVTVIHASRWALMKSALAFGSATRATLVHALATGRTTVALKLMGRAAWASLGPYIIIVAIIAAVVAAFYTLWKGLQSTSKAFMAFSMGILTLMGPVGWIIMSIGLLYRSVKEFGEFMDTGIIKEGFLGRLQRVGGIIKGVVALWNGFDSSTNTFEISQSMMDAMERLGLKETFLNLSTWIARVKNVFAGFTETMGNAWDWISEKVGKFTDKFGGLLDKLPILGIMLDKNTSDIDKWKRVGEIAAYVLIGGFVAMALAAGFAAVAMVLPFVIPIALAYGLYKAVGFVIEKFQELKVWAGEIWETGKSFGANLVEGIVSGIKEMWESLKSSVTDILGFMVNPFGVFDGAFGIDQKVSMAPVGAGASPMDEMGGLRANRASAATNYSSSTHSTERVGDIRIPINLNGRKIGEEVIDMMNIEKSRS